MPDLTIEKLILFLFAVVPGFVAIQAYGLRCPAKRDWGNSIIEVVSYSSINLIIWMSWVIRIVTMPIRDLSGWELTAATACVCILSPIGLSLGWYWLRTSLLHHRMHMDHPTPNGWDHFIRNHSEFWILFHWKDGKISGGYFGPNSYASTYPHAQEICVEEMWRVNDRGEFVEKIENTLGGVIRIDQCERVEFQTWGDHGNANGKEGSSGPDGALAGRQSWGPTSGPDGYDDPAGHPHATHGGLVNGSAEKPGQVT